MQGIVLTNKGIESACAQELSELGMLDVRAGDQLVAFSCRDEQELCRVAYLSQSAERVLRVLADRNAADVLGTIDELELEQESVPGKVRLECVRVGEHDFSSVEVKSRAARLFKQVDYDQFDTVVFVLVIGQRLVIGVDIAGVDLSKREYKVFANSFSLKAPVAYALVRLSGWTGSGVLLDPLCRDGMIAIEAAHLATGASVRRFEKRKLACADLDALDVMRDIQGGVLAVDWSFPNISAAKKNAKIAGMHKVIDFRRYVLDDIDLHVEPGSIEAVVTSFQQVPPLFFERLAPVLKRSGRMVVLCARAAGVVELASKAGFVVREEAEFFMGKLACRVFLFGKKPRRRASLFANSSKTL